MSKDVFFSQGLLDEQQILVVHRLEGRRVVQGVGGLDYCVQYTFCTGLEGFKLFGNLRQQRQTTVFDKGNDEFFDIIVDEQPYTFLSASYSTVFMDKRFKIRYK